MIHSQAWNERNFSKYVTETWKAPLLLKLHSFTSLPFEVVCCVQDQHLNPCISLAAFSVLWLLLNSFQILCQFYINTVFKNRRQTSSSHTSRNLALRITSKYRWIRSFFRLQESYSAEQPGDLTTQLQFVGSSNQKV